MKVNPTDNLSVYTNGDNTNQTKAGAGEKNKTGTSSVNASNLNLLQDPIQAKRREAQKKAMDIVRSQFKADGVIDTDLKERRNRIAENKAAAGEALKEINALSEEQEKLKEAYGIKDDSQEQQDLELRIKAMKATRPDSQVKLSEEEWQRYQELGPASEYQQASMALESAKGLWRKEINEASKAISTETQIIRATEQEMVKHHGMDDADAVKEQYLEAASKEIIGMMMDEVKENVDEKLEEAVEKGQEQKEEKEKLEALREEKKAEREANTFQPEEVMDILKIQKNVEEQIQNILEEQKLLEEDLKGLQVNSIV